MTVTLPEFIQLTPEIQKDLRLAMREAVNKSALAVTQDARERVKLEIGPEQRLSGSKILFSWTVEQPGTESRRIRTKADPAGRRINPAYKPADSETKPTALIGARGPAQWIEHDRRGGYDIAPRAGRQGRPGAAVQSEVNTFVQSMLGGPMKATKRGHAPAVGRKGGNMFRAKVKGGFILRPLGGPIADAFRAAPRTVAQLAENIVAARVNRMRY
jgi:hypothetical protein